MPIYEFEKADKDLFAVYQTVYSQADIELWFTWSDRLNDTKWSENCYFLCHGGAKIGGAIISDGLVVYAFVIPPFCARRLFWKLVIGKAREVTAKKEIVFKGVLEGDVNLLQNCGVRIWRARQMMCRPTDIMPYSLPDDIVICAPVENDIQEIAEVQRQSFTGSISYEMFGEDSIEHIVDGVKKCFEWFSKTDSMEQLIVARHKPGGKIIGACIAGINPEMPNLFAGIDDVVVLPEYRGRGIAEAMIRHSVTAAHPKTPVIKLHVLVNNPAASLYHKLGFIAGPMFTDMRCAI